MASVRTIELVEESSQLCTFEFDNELGTDELVTGVTSIEFTDLPIDPATGLEVADPPVISGTTHNSINAAQCRIACPVGSANFTYPALVIVTTDDSNIKAEFFYVRVVKGLPAVDLNQ